MREYRGKRVDNGEWVYGFLQPVFAKSGTPERWCIIRDCCIFTKESDFEIIEDDKFEVLPESVGQYIGLKDKNGVKVYGGDDVDVSMSFEGGTLPHRGYIVYDNEFGAFGTKNDAGVTLLHNHCLHTLKVIGNITDSPNLLESPK